MIVQNHLVSLEFDTVKANISSLINKVSNDSYIKSDARWPIISIIGFYKGKWTELKPNLITCSADESYIEVEIEKFGDRNISASLILNLVEDKIIVNGSIYNNDEDFEICEILNLRLSGISLGDDYKNNVIYYPHHAGEKTVNPVDAYASDKYLNFWRAGSKLIDNVYRREINYCGLASMTWMYLEDVNNGLYIGSHDAKIPVTGVIAESEKKISTTMGFGFRKHNIVKSGEFCSLGEYVISVNSKSWHYGAEIYRDYFFSNFEVVDTPDYLNDQYAMNQCYSFKRADKIVNGNRVPKIDYKFRDIKDLYIEGKELGINHFFMASWNRTGFDSYYPEFYPDMELGSAMEFRRNLEYIKNNGGISTLYINARIFDIKSDFHSKLGCNMAINNEYGDMIFEKYGPAEFTVNCPSDELWRDFLLDTAEFTVKAYGSDGIYLDQLASAEPFPCYNKKHSHKNNGEFNQGYVYVLENLLIRLRAFNKDSYIMTENCGDVYGCYTWGNLTWNGADYDEFYNLFKYTFPEFVQVNMVDMRGWVEDYEDKIDWIYKDLERAILLGSILWIGGIVRLIRNRKEENQTKVKAVLEYSLRALDFRKRIQPFIKRLKYFDNKFVSSTKSQCNCSTWLSDNDSMMMILLSNRELKEQSFCIIDNEKIIEMFRKSQVTVLSENGKDPSVSEKNGRIIIDTSYSRLSAVVFECK